MGDVVYLNKDDAIKTDMINFLSNLIDRAKNNEIEVIMISCLDNEGDILFINRGTFNAPMDCLKMSGVLDWQKKTITDAMTNMFKDDGKEKIQENNTEEKGED